MVDRHIPRDALAVTIHNRMALPRAGVGLTLLGDPTS
jgi:hypothetical protein